MIDQRAIDYIKNARAKNIPDDVIKQALMLNGWSEEQARTALSVTSQVQSVAMPVNTSTTQSSKRGWNSPLSVMLAFVLFIALLILSNHIIKDLTSDSLDTNGRLIVNAFLVLPFLLVAFLLHYSFHEQESKNKYLIIAQPYYFVAGWLLLKLLFQVSTYIMDKNSTYGVYVVLILTVAVLTGIIFFVQKYLRST